MTMETLNAVWKWQQPSPGAIGDMNWPVFKVRLEHPILVGRKKVCETRNELSEWERGMSGFN